VITVIRVCRKCGAKIFSDAPEGLCTRCVLETALRTLPEETIASTRRDDVARVDTGQRLFGRYTLIRILGRGGMGIVWLAHDEELERNVALKFLPDLLIQDAAVLSDLKRETRRCLELTHKNIVRIYDFVHDERSGCISMEYVDGDTLSKLRCDKERKVFEAAELTDWMSQLCDALDYAHNYAHIVHRDLKPANLMVNQRGELKVSDFGIARSLGASLSVITMAGGRSGTLAYMSPQQLEGERGTHLDDIYSLGATVYELLTSKPPFYLGNIDRQIREKIPPSMAERRKEFDIEEKPIPTIWEEWVAACLAKDPGRRPQSVLEIARQLQMPSPKGSAPALRKSIAVLPFENLSEDKANAYFADGIQEEILTRLSRIGDLKVISRTSTQRFKNSPEDISHIARQLGVANILEGGVRKAGDQVRVHVQLIDAESDSHLWAERYDRKLTDIFAVESDIAAKIADALQAKLTGAERRAISSQPTENTEAHQLYLKGLYHWRNFFAPGYERIRDYFQRAIELDASYALAYTGLGRYYAFGAALGILAPNESWPKAEEALNEALTLDDTLAEVYHLLAGVELYYKRDWPAAERAFRHGLELNPSFADMRHHYGICLVLFGRTEEGLTQMDHARQLDPFFPGQNLHHARIFFFLRDYDRAVTEFARTLDLHPAYAAAHEYLGDACEKKGLTSEAVTQWTAALNLSGEAEQAKILEQTFAAAGFEAAVRALAQKQLERLQEKTARGDYVPAWHYLMAYVRLGDNEQAFAWLAKAVEERNWFALQIKVNPILDPLRGDWRFDALVQKVLHSTNWGSARAILRS
jgi:eukaryotic-like serine/threonine-protein kinase